MKRAVDGLGAFVPGGMIEIAGERVGPLRGLSFAVKDIFDIAGTVTGRGNPSWAAVAAPASRHAAAVERLLRAGASLVGKTITDELAFSLNGQNPHYGAPVNVNAPGRITGGSSSGSASAVAGGLVDLALGSDTGGSVRIPASYCGIYGMRPSYGRISVEGIMPLAPSLDTVGCFARDPTTLSLAYGALFDRPVTSGAGPFRRLLLAADAFAFAEPGVGDALVPFRRTLEGWFGAVEPVRVAEGPEELIEWAEHFRALLRSEVWEQHRAWIESDQLTLGPELTQRLEWAETITPAEMEAAASARIHIRERLIARLGTDGVLCLPTAPGIAPRLDASEESVAEHRLRVYPLTCIAGLAGLPQVTLPVAKVDGCPVGISLLGGPDSDEALLALAEELENPDGL